MRHSILVFLILIPACSKQDDSGTGIAEQSVKTSTQTEKTEKVSSDLPSNQVLSEAVKPTQSDYVNLTNRRIGDLKVGTSAWIFPWSVWITSDRESLTNNYYINGYHEYFDHPLDDSFLRIVRNKDGFDVYMEKSKTVWTPIEINVGKGSFDAIPVNKFIQK